mgnify:CR=1 FL=1
MPYLLPPFLLTLLALLPLLRAAHRRYAPADPAAEQRALIAAWRTADDPAGQDERKITKIGRASCRERV